MKNKQFYPLAMNIMTLQAYTKFFQLDERVMFEWFIVNDASFRTEFFYSVRRIAEETGIRKARLDTILKWFKSLGIISYEAQGMPKTYHYQVHRQRVLELLPKIYNLTNSIAEIKDKDRHKFYEISKLLTFFSKQLPENGKHKEYYKNSKEEEIRLERKGQSSEQSSTDSFESEHSKDGYVLLESNSAAETENIVNPEEFDFTLTDEQIRELQNSIEKNNLELASQYITLLKDIHKDRLKLHNEDPKGKAGKVYTSLAFDRRSRLLLVELFENHEEGDIKASFTAFIDKVLDGQLKIKKPMPYFLKKDLNGEFSTFFTFLDKFAVDYRLRR